MKKIVLLCLPLLLLCKYSNAQVYIEPFTGYQADLNGNGFKQFNTGLQCSFKSKWYELVLQVQQSWPFKNMGNDSAFTTNPSLPLYTNAQKTIKPAATSFAIGHRIKLAGKNSPNIVYFFLSTGITNQHIEVNYQYDKNNYSVLNPDQTISGLGLFASAGVEYMRLLKNGRLFFQLNVAAPTLLAKHDYPSSFRFIAPLAFNAGYSILLKKNKHAK